jgi:hypothetical protein
VAKRLERLVAESSVGFGHYAMKLGLTTAFLVFDLLGIPSVFQAFGMFGFAYVIPVAAVIGVAGITEFWVLYRMK